jgi:hypothetical protein
MIADRYEIDDAEKELFTQAVERLEPLIGLHVPKKPGSDGSTALEKIGTFKLDGMLIEVSTSEIVDDTKEAVSKGYDVTTTQEVAVDGIRLVTTALYNVDKFTEDAPWEAFFHASDTLHDPSSEEPVSLPDDYEREAEAFWDSNPSPKEVTEWLRAAELDEEECGSEWSPSERFTKARLRRILPLLQQLGPEHLVDAQVW